MTEWESRSSSGDIPPPKCKAILLCDQTIVEAGTGKISVIGVFDRFVLSEVPGVLRPFTVFVQLTNGVGRYEFSVEIHDLREDTVLARSPTVWAEWKDRLATVNLLIPVPPMQVQHLGAYDLVLLANGEEIDRQQFRVDQPPSQPEEAQSDE